MAPHACGSGWRDLAECLEVAVLNGPVFSLGGDQYILERKVPSFDFQTSISYYPEL